MSEEGQPQPERSPQEMAVGYIREAESYRLAALRVHPKGAPTSDTCLLMPAWNLLCHASELALKAYLLSGGADTSGKEGGLKHIALRHNLLGLYELAAAQGFKAPDEEFGELMDWLAPFHSEHVFRYRKTGRITLASPYYMGEILEPVIAQVEKTVRERWKATQQG